ncbi:SDR family oxidoreductase [Glaciihabitans sp. INWT7]|uniref:SDR family NAD(P)-dependent oxidoreductase n=1 Tax=Glaciihabitans sp. INWT7 TaxID=2596912 RepID=UPI0016242632|nr:SDR family oxidoreductase [Glaciihabitans sp. INWT7]QNE47807.1 SDR family oxidoreductase [Glaciihabitans sp. INWT7]
MGVALVTGGTSGIGAAFARLLAARGYDLVLVARSTDRLETMAAELRATGRTVELLPADLSDRNAVARVAERLSDPERPIDMLVNNAGFGMHSSSLDPDVSEFDRAFEVMCRAVFVLSGAAARGMVERGSGSILNVSSTAGFLTMGAYSSIKAWVTSYTEGLAVELRGSGVTVTALCPGWVRTEFHERAGIRSGSIPNFMWLDAEQLVSAALRDVDRGKVISIPTLRYRALIGLAGLAPKSAIRSFSGAISSSRRKPVVR